MAYVKVYSLNRGNNTKGTRHHAIEFFKPGTPDEAIAYGRAADVMRNYPGARWAVSEVTGGLCAALPVLCDPRSREAVDRREKVSSHVKAILQSVHTGETTPETPVIYRDGMVDLARRGYCLEVFPNRWELTEVGVEQAVA